jgi:phage host-nuclease inhibitor protein Gam
MLEPACAFTRLITRMNDKAMILKENKNKKHKKMKEESRPIAKKIPYICTPNALSY